MREYLEERMSVLGLTDEDITLVCERESGGVNSELTPAKLIFFDSDEEGNILINYFRPNFYPYRYRPEGNKWEKEFQRIRLKNPDGKGKYRQPRKTGVFPFFPKNLLKKWRDGETIETLYFTEGELKAFKADFEGLDVVGFPSIQGPYKVDVRRELHEDLQRLIVECGVKSVVFLTDADTISLKYEADKDLSKRPASFFAAIRNFFESLDTLLRDKRVELEEAFWAHIKTKYCEPRAVERDGEELILDGKGLDDLLVLEGKDKSRVIDQLRELKLNGDYVEGMKLNDSALKRIRLKLGSGNKVEQFYDVYASFLDDKVFRWKNRRYQFNGEEVTYLRHDDADLFLRVGSDWYKRITKLNRRNESEEELIPFKIGEIQRDYGKKFPDFIDSIKRYDSFTIEPDTGDNYRRVIHGAINLFEPLTHTPEPGSIKLTLKYLKHVFQGNGFVTEKFEDGRHSWEEHCEQGDPFTVAMDYLTIMYRYPKQKLCVPILVSPENITGKSTFLKWQQAIWGSANGTILDNERFKMKFNSHYASKFFIGLDEGFLDLEKRSEKERLKQLATADDIFLEDKGVNVKKIPYHGHLVICSNDADKVMQMDEQDTRWFVVRVPKIPKGEEDKDLESKIIDEIPHWLNYVKNREIFHPRESRLWFKPEWFFTQQMQEIIDNTKSRADALIYNFVRNIFFDYCVDSFTATVKAVQHEVNKDAKYRLDESDIRYYLKNKKQLAPNSRTGRWKYPIGYDDKYRTLLYQKGIGRFFKFNIADWLNEEEMRSVAESKAEIFAPDPDLITTNNETVASDTSETGDVPF
ncbi:primase-helicase family protein [Fulvitalea axinellae]